MTKKTLPSYQEIEDALRFQWSREKAKAVVNAIKATDKENSELKGKLNFFNHVGDVRAMERTY